MTLNAIYQEAAEAGYLGFVAELPSAITQGETLEETRESLQEAALRGWEVIGEPLMVL